MRVQAMREIWSAIDAIECDESAKSQFRNLVRQISHDYGIRTIALSERLKFTIDLLAQGLPRMVIRDRLMHAYRINERTCNRVISNALELRRTAKLSVLQMTSNVGVRTQFHLCEVMKNANANGSSNNADAGR